MSQRDNSAGTIAISLVAAGVLLATSWMLRDHANRETIMLPIFFLASMAAIFAPKSARESAKRELRCLYRRVTGSARS